MALTIKQARSSQRLVDILEHRNLCLFDRPGKAIDHFDVLPSTVNIASYQGNSIVGSARLIELTENIFDTITDFNFREATGKTQGTSGYIDLMTMRITEDFSISLLVSQIKMAALIGIQKGYKIIFISLPDDQKIDKSEIELYQVGDHFNQNKMWAISLDHFQNQLELKIADKEILRFKECFYYTIFGPGEVIVAEGERGSSAYVAENSEVEIVIRNRNELISIGRIPPGQLIGEVAMLTNEKRTASLLATKMTNCVSFDRTDFFNILEQEPHRSVELFRIFSRRIASSNKKLAELREAKP